MNENVKSFESYSLSIDEIMKNTTKAIESYAILSEDNDLAYQLTGMSLSQLKKDDEAIKCLDIPIQMNPLNPLAYGYKGKIIFVFIKLY
jgi:tetratricopeptide (TPR) repeat protein